MPRSPSKVGPWTIAPATLEQQVESFDHAHPGEIPRPPFWQGFAIRAQHLEFWADGPDRLHNRRRFTREASGWSSVRLYP